MGIPEGEEVGMHSHLAPAGILGRTHTRRQWLGRWVWKGGGVGTVRLGGGEGQPPPPPVCPTAPDTQGVPAHLGPVGRGDRSEGGGGWRGRGDDEMEGGRSIMREGDYEGAGGVFPSRGGCGFNPPAGRWPEEATTSKRVMMPECCRRRMMLISVSKSFSWLAVAFFFFGGGGGPSHWRRRRMFFGGRGLRYFLPPEGGRVGGTTATVWPGGGGSGDNGSPCVRPYSVQQAPNVAPSLPRRVFWGPEGLGGGELN